MLQVDISVHLPLKVNHADQLFSEANDCHLHETVPFSTELCCFLFILVRQVPRLLHCSYGPDNGATSVKNCDNTAILYAKISRHYDTIAVYSGTPNRGKKYVRNLLKTLKCFLHAMLCVVVSVTDQSEVPASFYHTKDV